MQIRKSKACILIIEGTENEIDLVCQYAKSMNKAIGRERSRTVGKMVYKKQYKK